MNALSKILLVTASFQSLITLSMEQTQTVIQPNDLIADHKESLTQLYSLTQFVLSNSESLGYIHSSFSEKPTHNLLTIIATTNDLRKKRISEERIARLAYTKEPSLFEKDESFLEKFEQFVSHNHKASNYHIAVFFKRLERYNDRLVKNEFTSPTFEQYKDYIANKALEISYKKNVKVGNECGLLLDETMIHTNNEPFVAIPINSATEELDKFINDIKLICDKNIPRIKSLADMLYLNNKENNTHNTEPENKDK